MALNNARVTKVVLGLEQAQLDDDTALRWCCLDVDGNVVDSGVSQLGHIGEEVPALSQVQDINVLVFGGFVRLCMVALPTRNPRQIKQALPYAVEELIADNIEDVHLALPVEIPDQGDIPVAVVRHQLLIEWLDTLYRHGIAPLRLSPAVLTLPWHAGQLVVMEWQQQLMVRHGRFSGQWLALEHAEVLLPALLQTSGNDGLPPQLQVLGGEGVDIGPLCEHLAPLTGQQLDQRLYRETPFEVCAIGAADASGNINLLQGGYKVARETERQRRRWRQGIGLAAACLLGFVLAAGASGAWFHHRADTLDASSVAQYRQWFPEEARVVSPRRQLQSKLNSIGSGVDDALFPLLTSVALVSSGNDNVSVESLRYRAETAEMLLELRGQSLDAVENFRRQLQTQPLGVELNSAIDEGDYAVARIALRNAP